VTAFGVFIDIGVHRDGPAHVSRLADRFIKDPDQAVKVHQKVVATVLEVDVKRKRISLSLRKNPEHQGRQPQADLNALQQVFMKNRT
jgi:uncharacterized protein